MLGPDGCFDYLFDPRPVLGLREGLLATVLVAVPEYCDGTTRDELCAVPVTTGDLKVKTVPVSAAGEGGTKLHLFGNSAGEAGVEFGLKAFLIVEKAPWVKHSDRCSEAGFRVSVSEPPQILVFVGSLPGRGYDRCNAPKAAGPKPE